MLVRVVPIFAPIIMGTESANVKEPDATAATIIAVLVELLWIRAVISRPINKPIKGFEVATKIDSAASLPNAPKDSPIKSTASRKTDNDSRMLVVMPIVLLVFRGFF